MSRTAGGRSKGLRRMGFVVLGLVVAVVAGAVGFVALGVYDVASTASHTQPVYTLLEMAMRRSVQRRAADIAVPPLADAGLVARGGLCFRDKCVQCHGGPGTAQAEIGRSIQPLPGPLVDATQKWTAAELYWITRHGITMSGMPAWQHRMPDADLWAVVAFMQTLPMLDVAAFRRAAGAETPGSCNAVADLGVAARAPDAERGRAALTQYACSSCHRIPGVTGSEVHVGPPLAGIAGRQLLAGKLANTPENMVRWLMDPRAVDPATAMPAMGVNATDARDIAAFLASLR